MYHCDCGVALVIQMQHCDCFVASGMCKALHCDRGVVSENIFAKSKQGSVKVRKCAGRHVMQTCPFYVGKVLWVQSSMHQSSLADSMHTRLQNVVRANAARGSRALD